MRISTNQSVVDRDVKQLVRALDQRAVTLRLDPEFGAARQMASMLRRWTFQWVTFCVIGKVGFIPMPAVRAAVIKVYEDRASVFAAIPELEDLPEVRRSA